MKDYYKILGVSPSATGDDIRKAYKKLAMTHHPDRGGDSEKFAAINEAYAVLSDPQQRHEYDNPSTVRVQHGPGAFNFDNFFNMFGGHPGHGHRTYTYRMQLWTTLYDAAVGGIRQVSLNTPRGASNVEITLPGGYEDGDSVRYPGIGPDRGDLVVTFRIQPDSKWHREGANITTDVTIPVWNLILGTTAGVTCIDGTRISVTVPPRTQPGTLLRIKNHGMPVKNASTRGDLFVRVQTALPNHIPDVIIDCIRQHGLT